MKFIIQMLLEKLHKLFNKPVTSKNFSAGSETIMNYSERKEFLQTSDYGKLLEVSQTDKHTMNNSHNDPICKICSLSYINDSHIRSYPKTFCCLECYQASDDYNRCNEAYNHFIESLTLHQIYSLYQFINEDWFMDRLFDMVLATYTKFFVKPDISETAGKNVARTAEEIQE